MRWKLKHGTETNEFNRFKNEKLRMKTVRQSYDPDGGLRNQNPKMPTTECETATKKNDK